MGRRRYTLRAAAVLAVASHPGAPSLFRRAEGKFVAATRQRRAQEHGLGREFLDPTVGGIVNRFAVGRRREALRGSFLKAWGWKRSVRGIGEREAVFAASSIAIAGRRRRFSGAELARRTRPMHGSAIPGVVRSRFLGGRSCLIGAGRVALGRWVLVLG